MLFRPQIIKNVHNVQNLFCHTEYAQRAVFIKVKKFSLPKFNLIFTFFIAWQCKGNT